MVGDGDRRLAVGGDRGHHLLDPGGAVEHGVLSVEMKVDKARRTHSGS